MTEIPAGVLQSILRRLDRLEAQTRPASGEQLIPNYLRANPDGTVGALFPGGVQLEQGTSLTPPLEEAITWQAPNNAKDSVGNSASELLSAYIAGLGGTDTDLLSLDVSAIRGALARVVIGANNYKGAGQLAQLELDAAETIGDGNTAITASTSQRSVKILDDAGASTFLYNFIPQSGDWGCAFGVTAWSAAATTWTGVTFNYGVTFTRGVALIASVYVAAGINYPLSFETVHVGFGDGQVNLMNNGAAANGNVYWVAVGGL